MSILWTEEEFQRIAINTRLSSRTLSACHDVLVDGLSGVDAAKLRSVLPTQISRSINAMRDRQEELLKSVAVLSESANAMKLIAVKEAQQLGGEKAVIKEAVVGQAYEGTCLQITPGFAIQKVGRFLVIHDLGRLSQEPPTGKRLKIEYPEGGGLASVSESVKDKGEGEVLHGRRATDVDKGGVER